MSSSRSTSVTPGRNAHSAGDMGMAGRNGAAAAGAGFTSAGGRSKMRTASTMTMRTASSAAVSASCSSRKRSTIRRVNGEWADGRSISRCPFSESGRVKNAEQSKDALQRGGVEQKSERVRWSATPKRRAAQGRRRGGAMWGKNSANVTDTNAQSVHGERLAQPPRQRLRPRLPLAAQARTRRTSSRRSCARRSTTTRTGRSTASG